MEEYPGKDLVCNEQPSHISRPPAEGERNAIVGYHGQYSVAASLILRHLREEKLEKIRVADPRAERVDDFLMFSQGRIDAHQVKWSRFPDLFTLNDLTKTSNSAPSIFSQLARGWKKLKGDYPTRRIVVHFVTNGSPSTSTNAIMPLEQPAPSPNHFAAFIEQVWNPAHNALPNEGFEVPETWSNAWKHMRIASGLDDEEFESFVGDCNLDLSYNFDANLAYASETDKTMWESDIGHIVSMIFETVADPGYIIELSWDQLLQRLGWSNRFELRSRHEFPVDEKLYRAIDPTVQELLGAISKLAGGYIALLGTPGSGKSTLLTKTLRALSESERVVSYYAYVPDDQGLRSLRGESANFFHDLVLQFDRAGFRVGKSISIPGRAELGKRFYKQLHDLHNDWTTTGRKTIILVDGLDHIERAQKTDRSLLFDLPEPDQVPDGVYFVIGTQTEASIPSRIRASIQNQDRKIKMQPLKRQQALDIMRGADLGNDISPSQQDLIFDRSAGHPLALSYIVNRLRLTENTEQVVKEIEDSALFEGDIEATYATYWDQFEGDADLKHLLGLIARIRGVIDLSWVRRWANASSVERIGSFAHYFNIEGATKWRFFHDSFRLFLTKKTAEFPAGCWDPDNNRSLYRELADKCASEPADSFWAWEELFYRASAEQHDRVLDIASQEHFRNQFLFLRPADAIYADILLALHSAVRHGDQVALVRLLLIGAELNQRDFYLDKPTIVSTLLGLRRESIALEYLRNGNQLLVEADAALESVIQLEKIGQTTESKRIFEMAEPLSLLSGHETGHMHGINEPLDLLMNWAKAAAYFREVNDIVRTIRSGAYQTNRGIQASFRGSKHQLQAHLLYLVGLELLAQKRQREFFQLIEAFEPHRSDDALRKFWLHFRALHDWAKDSEYATDQLHFDAMLAIDRRMLGPMEITALAEAVLRLHGDAKRAQELIENIDQPDLNVEVPFSNDGMRPYMQRFRLNRLIYALGSRQLPSEIIADPYDPSLLPIVRLERAVCAVAKLSARGWMGRMMDAAEAKQEVVPLLRVFYEYSQPGMKHWPWYIVGEARDGFHDMLIGVIATHGPKSLVGLCDAFEEEWSDSRFGEYWPISRRRSAIRSLSPYRNLKQWARDKLQELNCRTPSDGAVEERVQECLEHAGAWLGVGDLQQAEQFLTCAIQLGFSVGSRKDYQLNQWVGLLGHINSIEPKEAPRRISQFVHAIERLKERTESRVLNSAAKQLISTTWRWSPIRAIRLFVWFVERGLLNHASGLRTIIDESVKSSSSPAKVINQVFCDLLLPFDHQGDADLVSQIVRSLCEDETPYKFAVIGRDLASKIRLHATPGARSEWLGGLTRAMEGIGLSGLDIGVTKDELVSNQSQDVSKNVLHLRGEPTPLERQEVEKRADSLHDIEKLLMLESEDSFFNWEPVVSQHIRSFADDPSLINVVNMFREKRDSSRILVQVSKRMHGLGNNAKAWEVARDGLDATRPLGWDPWFDGGDRLNALEALKVIDREQMLQLSCKLLLNDLQNDPKLFSHVTGALDKVLQALGPINDKMGIWNEIEGHTSSLLSIGETHPITEVFDGGDSRGSPEEALLELMAWHLDHPCQTIVQASQRALGNLLLDGNDGAFKILERYLHISKGHQECVLILLDAVSSRDSKVLNDLRENVIELVASPNWSVRSMATSIARNCGWHIPFAKQNPKPLPPIYSINLPTPGLIGSIGESLEALQRSVPDSNNPEYLISPFNDIVRKISSIANLPYNNLVQRVIEKMHELAPRQSSWSADAEEKLRSLLRSAGIRVPYVRPRPRIARSAIFYAVAELDDASKISASDSVAINNLLRHYDPTMILAQPLMRPQQIAPIGDFGIDVKLSSWVALVGEALTHTVWSPKNGRVVVAEKTSLKWVGDSEQPQEVRCSLLTPYSHTDIGQSSEPNDLFSSVENYLISEYENIHDGEKISPMAIRNNSLGFDSPGAQWLAFNPSLARHLGWKLARDGMFKWNNAGGETMVESMWWMDGLLALSGIGLGHGGVGEGWVTIASKSAIKKIKREFGQLSRRSMASRQFRRDGQLCSRSSQSILPFEGTFNSPERREV